MHVNWIAIGGYYTKCTKCVKLKARPRLRPPPKYGIMCAMEAAEEAKIISEALEESKAEDVKIYDVRGKSSLTDFFVVATGSAAPHLKALVANAQQAMREAGVKRNRMTGDPECGWIVADFIDVVVHVFSREARAYYAIEKLWA